MEREQSWQVITKIGANISNKWKELAQKHSLNINTWGLPAMSGYTFESKNAIGYKTLITQEMLKKGYLAGNSVYACTEHSQEILDGYFAALEPIFEIIKQCEDGRNLATLLDGPICHSGFKRLN